MNEVLKRVKDLSPEKQKLLLQAIQRNGAEFNAFPLSFAQQRLWYLHLWDPSSPVYNSGGALWMNGDLNVEILTRCLREIVGRHEILRTVFVALDGQPFQIIQEEIDIALPMVDLSGSQGEQREIAVQKIFSEEARRPFAIEEGSLIRFKLVRLNEERHALLVVMHHIVADGWSTGVLAREFSTLYEAFYAGKPSPLRALPIQYADFANWQNQWLQGPVFERLVNYWASRLSGDIPLLQLPTDWPRPAVQTFKGARHPFRLSVELRESLISLSRQSEATLFMTLLAAFAVLLHRYSGQTDIVIGAPVANRNRVELESLIGFFVNTLPLRFDLSGNPKFRSLLEEVRQVTMGAYSHQDLPFEKLVDLIHPERSLSHGPLLQAVFVLQNEPAAVFELPGLAVTLTEVENGASKFDLTISLTDTENGLSGWLEYNTDLFMSGAVTGLLDHYTRLLQSIVANPDRPVSDLPMLSPAESHRIVRQWNETLAEYPSESTIAELFEQQVERRPDAIAAVAAGEQCSYGELNRRANRLAHLLLANGVGPEGRVGCQIERSIEALVVMLAVSKAGGAYLPIDRANPWRRTSLMLKQAGVRLVIGLKEEESAESEMAREGVRRLDLGGIAEALAAQLSDNPRTSVCGENLAYVMYTSGSTGEPKGVEIPHKGVARLVKGADYASLGEEEVMLHLSPLAFDASTFEVWGALLNGGRLVVVEEGPVGLEEIELVIEREAVTTMWLTAGLFDVFVDERIEGLKGVRQLLAGGDVLSARRAKKVKREVAGCEVINGYGPTESTTFACSYKVKGDEGERIPIGRPISNTRVYLLDGELQVVGVGMEGELYIAGAGLARGYLREGGLTAESFLPNPYSLEAGERLYRTGDVGKYLQSGAIEFRRRRDRQVKLRGYRIEPGEIDSALRRCEGVQESVTVVSEAAPGEKELVTYVLLKNGGDRSEQELESELRERLPAYMAPRSVKRIERLPLTANGKIDYAALSRPDQVKIVSSQSPSRFRTPTEEKLVDLWADTLGIPAPGIHDNFFALGGNSLLAARLVSRTRIRFQVSLPLRRLFEKPTVAGIAEIIDGERRFNQPGDEKIDSLLKVDSNELSIPPRDSSITEAALSPGQQRLWILYRMDPMSPAYNVPAAIRWEGPLNQAALEDAFEEITRRHEILRTSFLHRDGQPRQLIGAVRPVRARVVDLTSAGRNEAERLAPSVVKTEIGEGFKLEEGECWRLALVKLGEDSYVVILTMSHIVCDGWSMMLLVKELAALYEAYANRRPSPLAMPPVQYADYAIWSQEWLAGERLQNLLSYWTKRLEGIRKLEFPTDHARSRSAKMRGRRYTRLIPEGLKEDLKKLSRQAEATLFMTLTAAFNLLLMDYTQEQDICIGTPVANRPGAELGALIGFFANMVLLRVDLRGDPTFHELIGRVKEAVLEAYEHQALPFERLVEELQPERDGARSPLLGVVLAYQEDLPSEMDLAGAKCALLDADTGAAKFELMLTVVERNRELACVWEYDSDLFEDETIERLHRHWENVLRQVAADAGRTLSSINAPGAGERPGVVRRWNETEAKYPLEATVAETAIDQALLEESYKPPQTEIERKLQALFADALRLDRIGVDDDFFSSGGHSLKAMQLVARIEKELNVKVPLKVFFENPAIRPIARFIDSSAETGYQRIQPLPSAEFYELSHAQTRLWLAHQLNPNSSAYHMPFVIDLDDDLDPEMLQKALATVVKRHESLRTVFAVKDGRPVQIVKDQVRVEITIRPVSGPDEFARICLENAARPFDLENGPLFHALILASENKRKSLFWNISHIVSDGWSMEILKREITSLLNAYKTGEAPALPPLPIQYKDFAAWQNQRGSSPEMEADGRFWREILGGDLPELELPFDFPYGGASSLKGAAYRFRSSRSAKEELGRLARQNHTSVFPILLSCLYVLLNRMSGQTDLIIGAPVAGRDHEDVRNIIGFFLNTVMLRMQIEPEERFIDLLRKVKELTIKTLIHQNYPFEKLIGELNIRRDPVRFPISSVFINMLNYPEHESFSGTKEDGHCPLNLDLKFEFEIYVRELEEGLSFSCHYRRDLFRPETIEYLMAEYLRLIESIATWAPRRIEEIDLFDKKRLDVKRRLVRPDVPFTAFRKAEPEQSISSQFEQIAQVYSDLPAVRTRTSDWSYSFLNQYANRLASVILKAGSAQRPVVALLLDHDEQMIAAVLATLKAGGCYVPLSPSYPEARLAFMLADSGAGLIVTNDRNLNQAGELAKAGLGLVNLDRIDLEAGCENLSLSVSPDATAYLLYTSGSTGRPKGVVQTHRNVLHFIRSYTNRLQISASDRLTLLSPYTFDASIVDIFAALLNGATLYPFDLRGHRAEELAGWLLTSEITVYHSTPTIYRHWVASFSGLESFPSLRLIVLGGETVHNRDVDLYKTRFSSKTLLANLYGSTESTITSLDLIDHQTPVNRNVAPFYDPVDDTEMELFDEAGSINRVFGVGEIVVKSRHVAPGYWHDAQQTGGVFAPDFSDASRIIYRTGDLGRLAPDGGIEFVGRADFQLKVRGHRIEVAEIETALRTIDGVKDVVVVARPARRMGEEYLCAYLVWRAEARSDLGKPMSPRELSAYLARQLPDYMIPSHYVSLDELPLTTSGKIDRRGLPDPDQEPPEDQLFESPRTPTEGIIAQTWREVLNLERVGVNENFFDLGGHSLLAIELLTRLRERLGVETPLRILYESPTVADLAAAVSQARDPKTGPDHSSFLETIVPCEDQRHLPFPLTDIQQAYWIGRSAAFELGNVATHSYLEVEGEGLDLERMNAALGRLIARHDMLRAVVLEDGRQRIIAQVPPYRIQVLDLREGDREEAEAKLLAIRDEMSHQVLPVDRWPLFEIRASLLNDRLFRLHISTDALIRDASSWRILIREAAMFYQNPDLDLGRLDLSFRDYVLAERALESTDLYRRSEEYWSNRLASLPPAPEAPLAKNPASITNPRFKRRSGKLEEESWLRLKTRAASAKLTPSALLLAAYAQVLAAWCKSPRFTLNLTLFQRLPLHPEVNQIVGDFTSLTLLAVDYSEPVPFESQARRIQEQLWNDLDHRYFGGVKALRGLARARGDSSKAAMPLVFTSALNLDSSHRTRFDASSLGKLVYSITQTPQVWIDHQVLEQAGALVFHWDAVEELFPEGLLQDLFDSYCRFLNRLVEEKESWTEKRPLLIPPSQLEQRAVLNAVASPPSDQLLHTLFLKQAGLQPDAVAVFSPVRKLTYGELAQRSIDLAHRLREKGARPNSLVAVVMEKGWEQVVAALGILQSGAAYLPIDPALPVERIGYLIEQGEVEIVVTQPWLEESLDWLGQVNKLSIDGDRKIEIDRPVLEPIQTPDDLAYVIYTSGSTGLPKGVMIDHRGAVNTILDVNRRMNVGTEDRVFALSSLSFDLSVYDIFGALAAGGAIIMPSASALKDPRHWADLMVETKATIWNSVPALMKMFVEFLAHNLENAPATLRLAMMSGDWIPVTLPAQIRTLFKEIDLFSLGGATEASIWSIIFPITEVDAGWTSIPYGRPMTNQKWYVFDDAMRHRPVWVPGQLYISGVGLAKGYWRDEDKTRHSFIIHPQTGDRLYRTGDFGRYLPDGNIEFLGREDFQVKIQGYRVELGEIEAALMEHPLVKSVVVSAVGDVMQSRRLAAYLVLNEETQAAPISSHRRGIEPVSPETAFASAPQRGLEKLQFKIDRMGLRQESGEPKVQLTKPEKGQPLIAAYLKRRSYRSFNPRSISFQQYSGLLSCLLQMEIEPYPLPKFRYPSAGSLYPVQTYLYIKPDSIEGIREGVYYYHPETHSLLATASGAHIDRSVHAQVNQSIFDESGFSIFLIGKLGAVEPVYGRLARDFCLLEAGYMSQLLMTCAPDYQIGLCPVGELDFEKVRGLFALNDDHIFLHALLGGRIEQEPDEVLPARNGMPSVVSLDGLSPIPRNNGDSRSAQFRKFLSGKLPEYMIPSSFVFLRELPLTANGKIDRKALPDPDILAEESAAPSATPSNDVERTLAEVWQEVLEVERVGVTDNFFDLGGNSLMMVRIYNKLRSIFGERVSIVKMFEYPTVSAFARYLSQESVEPQENSDHQAEKRKALRRRRGTKPSDAE